MLTVVSDKKIPIESTVNPGTVDHYVADVLSAMDYYAFGSIMPGRNFNSSSARYQYNGKETDQETGTQDYGMRIYNPSLGRFLSVDPLTAKYPMLTPYQFASNNPILYIDLDGLEGTTPPPPGTSHYRCTYSTVGGQTFRQVTAYDVDPNSLQRANEINAANGGLGKRVYGSQINLAWYPVAGPPPTVITTPTTVSNSTTTFSGGKQDGAPVNPSTSRTITVPTGGTISNASITVSTGSFEGNIITVTNLTTGASLWTSGDVTTVTTPLTATLTGISPGDQLQINQQHSTLNAATNFDIWNYNLSVTNTTTTTGAPVVATPSASPANQTVSSPGIPVTPKVTTTTSTSVINTTTNTPTTNGL